MAFNFLGRTVFLVRDESRYSAECRRDIPLIEGRIVCFLCDKISAGLHVPSPPERKHVWLQNDDNWRSKQSRIKKAFVELVKRRGRQCQARGRDFKFFVGQFKYDAASPL
ncbi:hypothetical protein CEXT_40081 [Caerostris extrusa]|uniref:Uncharacterized protein n=1 Tax=Caerostris extrusa TaxID=172846 RepID=A0AAV4MUD9_CAEEX|nr:hypothetical protein CEXT_40081 [Caerostris extrusa]